MTHKTFKNETFNITKINVKVNSLSETDPEVEKLYLETENNNVDRISYSANKKIETRSSKKDTVSGIEFEAVENKTENMKVSEIPEKLKKLQGLINQKQKVEIKTNVNRYTSEDGNNSFYITDSQIEDLEIVEEKSEEQTNSLNE